jgi:hypothetical protein
LIVITYVDSTGTLSLWLDDMDDSEVIDSFSSVPNLSGTAGTDYTFFGARAPLADQYADPLEGYYDLCLLTDTALSESERNELASFSEP